MLDFIFMLTRDDETVDDCLAAYRWMLEQGYRQKPLALAGDTRLLLAGALGLILGHIAMRRVFEKRLGGYTGDCLGAVQQTSEAGFYLAVLAVL